MDDQLDAAVKWLRKKITSLFSKDIQFGAEQISLFKSFITDENNRKIFVHIDENGAASIDTELKAPNKDFIYFHKIQNIPVSDSKTPWGLKMERYLQHEKINLEYPVDSLKEIMQQIRPADILNYPSWPESKTYFSDIS
jgi:hypothetical protein